MKAFLSCRLFALVLLLLLPVDSIRAVTDDLLPQPYPASRYDAMRKKSPFTLSSAADQAAAVGFASKLFLTGILRVGGESFATVMDKESKQRYMISAKPNEQNIQLVDIESGDDLSKVSVTLKKGDEKATLKYDFDGLKQMQPAVAPTTPTAAVQTGNVAPPPTPIVPTRIIQRPRRVILPSGPPR